ncbi:sushi, von Willebrand factor type A, EGF and pentraxin domain-containing protein 1 isoform X7 [Bactrocera dorsalis]|uniref:Sushi, von Willebrand factor type A, EGF and pentraxin domain-containing protein 1 isoform X7 n=1 Tax=Bactrocera dorsalis TaxID=27457 RepID=A0ABM3J7B7_BACDO|nr:sushi, von Willebrand factor type A, EGF and pentraxin domain-containing protein 1 isoform X7 [Bactrocera dorsalis]
MQKVLITFPKMYSFQICLLLIVTLCVSWNSAIGDSETERKNCFGWGQMKCWSGQCVSITDKCDGVQDCDDGSDELTSLCQTVLCKQHQFQCGYGACLPMEAKCNGTKECWDGTDEREGLCIKEIATILTPTTRIKSNEVTESTQQGVLPTVKTKPNISTELANTRKTTTTILDYSTDFEVTETSEKDLTTIPEVTTTSTQTTTNRPVTNTEDAETLETHSNGSFSERPHLTTTSINEIIITQKTTTSKPLIKPALKANVTRNYSEKNTQITTPIIRETTTTIYVSKQTDSSDTNDQEVSGQIERLPNGPVYHSNKTLNATEKSRNTNYPGGITTITELKKDKSKAEENNEKFKNRSNSTPSERTQVITTNENETMIPRKTSVHSPAAGTSADSFGSDQTLKKLSGPTTKDTVIKTPKIGSTIKTPPIKKNQTLPLDIRNSTPTEQPKGNGNNGQEVRQIQNQLAISQTTLYTRNVTTQAPNLKTNLSSSPNNSNESNFSVQSPIKSRADTGVLTTSPVSHVYKILNATENPRNVNYPGSINKTFINQYNMRKTTPPTTTNKATTKARNQCTLRRCDYPLICNVLLPGSQDSGKLHDKQARQSLFVGSEVAFNCDDGYVLEGVNRTTCKENGWSHKIPSCTPSCEADFKLRCTPPLKCVYEEPNIRTKKMTKHVIRNSFTDTVVREHFKLSFECDAGYLIEGSKIRICTAKGWSNVMPRCVNQCDVLGLGNPKWPLKCQKFDSTTRLTNNCQYSLRNRKVREGSYFEYSCEYGYNLNGVNRSTCLNDGWSSNAPTCIPWCDLKPIRPCKSPLICNKNPNRPRYFFSIINTAHPATSDLTVDFSCEFGYELVGAKVITCSKGGWSHSIPTCKKICCDASILDDCTFPLICWRYDFGTEGYTRIYKGSVQQLSQDEHLLIRCENGYNLSGENYLTCNGGKWYGTMPKCIATCREDLLPKCENPMTCTAYNYYTGSSQAIINNYSGSYRTYPQGSTVVFKCAYGHVLNGARTATCDFHGWRYEDGMYGPECQRISNTCDKGILDNCTYPLICEQFDPEFGDYKKIQISTHQKSISNAARIRFSCENGYVLDGSNALTCTGGKWDDYMPKCIVHSCRADLLPACKYPLTCTRYDSKFKSEQTIIDNNSNESANYALNTQIVFGCAEDFKLKGEEQTTCSANGWSHQQSLKLPLCVRISPCDPDIFKSCKPPVVCQYYEPNKDNWSMVQSYFLINYVAKNSIVSIVCENGFKLQGANYIYCKSKGWDNPIPKCVRA